MTKPLLTDADFASAATTLGCIAAAVKAVCQVEAPRGGFNPDGTPVTLFEAHIFHRYTNGRFDATHPDLSSPKWNRALYGKGWEAEQARLQRAVALDPVAARMSASWGRFQLMGFNFAICGFADVQAFVNAMYTSEASQLAAFVQYVKHVGLGDELRDKRWAAFALRYNGAEYTKNKYDLELAAAYKTFAA